MGRRSSRILQYFNHFLESQLYLPLMYVEVQYTNDLFNCYKCDHLLLHSEQGGTVETWHCSDHSRVWILTPVCSHDTFMS